MLFRPACLKHIYRSLDDAIPPTISMSSLIVQFTACCYGAALRCHEVTKSITTVCNQTRIRSVLGNVLERAEEKFSVGAYLHW